MTTRVLRFGRLQLRWYWPVALAVLLVAAGLVRLGLWQLDRAAEKIALQQDYAAAGNATATPITQLPLAGLPFDEQQHQNRLVTLDGHFLDAQSIFLIYQTFEQQLGFEVLTPFQLAGDERIVLVSRGWSGIADAAELAGWLPALPGPRQLQGQLYVPGEREAQLSNPSQNRDWPLIRRYVNLGELADLFDAPLFPYVVRLSAGQDGVLVRHWAPAATSAATGRHFSYALQWFAMALAVVATALLLASNLRQLWRERRQQP